MAKEIVLGVTGGIAAYKAADIVSRLKKEKYNVTVIMTEEAKEFVTPLTFATLSQNKVYSGMFDNPQVWQVEHVSLAKKADLILVAPATANLIAKVTCGLADDLLSCVIMDTKAPVAFAPAMNERMFQNPIVQNNIERLLKLGYIFIGPRKGRLACGEEGLGCLADIDDIVTQVKKLVK